MNKKAIGQATLIFILLLFISAMVMFAFGKKLSDEIKTSTRGSECLNSVTLNTLTKADIIVDAYQGTDTFCPKYELIFTKDNARIDYLKKKGPGEYVKKNFDKISYTDEITEKEIYRDIADEMMACWKQFGSGKVDSFWLPEDTWDDIFGLDAEGVGCRICTEVSFEAGVWSKELKDFKPFLKNNFPSKKVTDEGDFGSYYDLLAERTAGCGTDIITKDNCWEHFAAKDDIRLKTNSSIRPNEKYLVTFVRQYIDQNKGLMNVYLMHPEDYERICEYPLPFKYS